MQNQTLTRSENSTFLSSRTTSFIGRSEGHTPPQTGQHYKLPLPVLQGDHQDDDYVVEHGNGHNLCQDRDVQELTRDRLTMKKGFPLKNSISNFCNFESPALGLELIKKTSLWNWKHYNALMPGVNSRFYPVHLFLHNWTFFLVVWHLILSWKLSELEQ